jgi:hypothetical protein
MMAAVPYWRCPANARFHARATPSEFAPLLRPILRASQFRNRCQIRQAKPTLEALEDRLAPAFIGLQTTVATLAENVSTAAPVKVADIGSQPAATTASVAGADAALFEIRGGELFLKAGAPLDFETNPALDVVLYGLYAGDWFSPVLTIPITDVYEPPSVTLQPLVTSYDEKHEVRPSEDYHKSNTVGNPPLGLVSQVVVHLVPGPFDPGIKMADIVPAGDAVGMALSLSGSDAGLFRIYESALYLKRELPKDFNFEAKPSYSVTVNADDSTVGDGPEASATFTLAINDINEAPMLRMHSFVSELFENVTTTSPVRIGDMYIIDDALGEENLSLSGADAAFFEIAGNQLFMKAGTTLDFETQPYYRVTVVADDPEVGFTQDTTVALTIWVTDVPDLHIKAVRRGAIVNNIATFAITLANLGQPATSGVFATLRLPPELTLVKAGSTPGWVKQDQLYRFDVGTLAAGQSLKLTFKARISANAPSGKLLRVLATIGDNGLKGADDNIADNSSKLATRVMNSLVESLSNKGAFVG